MSKKAKAIYTLYKCGKISKSGVDEALRLGVITIEEYNYIIA